MSINTLTLAEDLGVLFGAIKEANDFRGATLTARRATIVAELAATYPSVNAVATGAVESAPAALSGYASALADACSQVIRTTVDADVSLPSKASDIDAALREWCRQMRALGQTLGESPVTSTTTAGGSNVGDPAFLGYVRDETGQDSDFVIPDGLFFTLQLHADNGGTRWAEGWRAV